MTTKPFTIEFFIGQVGADGRAGRISRAFRDMSNLERCPVREIGGHSYEIRDLIMNGNGASFHGVFAKFRTDDIPHAGSPGGYEREIELDDDEGLLEKNHFLYFRSHELLVYQRNGHGSTTNRLGAYFSDILNETVVFNPVLQLEPMRRLLRGDAHPRSLDLSFAKPTNPVQYPGNDWSNHLLNVLNMSGGVRMSLHISAEGRSSDPSYRYLGARIKRTVAQLMNNVDVTKAKFMVEEDGVSHPIDLIADRLLSRQDVTMNGRYPNSSEMYQALRRAKDDHRDALHEYFGDPDHAVG